MLSFEPPEPVKLVQHHDEGWQATLLLDAPNARLKLRNYRYENLAGLVEHCLAEARAHGYGKVVAEVAGDDWEEFLARGFTPEGRVDGFFRGAPGYFMAYFVEEQRQHSTRLERENEILEQVLTAEEESPEGIAEGYRIDLADPEDGEALAAFYGKLFTSYPSPLSDARYIRQQIESQSAIYLVAYQGREMASAAAAEVDWHQGHAELTNCATAAEHRGARLMSILLEELEQIMEMREIHCLYSTARATSFGMNLILKRLGYAYGGRLINHCHIMGELEDMNLWSKYPGARPGLQEPIH